MANGRQIRVLFQFIAQPGDLANYTEEDFRAAGVAWADSVVWWLGQSPLPPPDTVVGFVILNEFDDRVYGAYRSRYEHVLASTEPPPDQAVAEAEGMAAAEAMADRLAVPIRAFCGALRDHAALAAEVPDLVRAPGGMKSAEWPWAQLTLLPLVPDVLDQTLTHLTFHLYRTALDFGQYDFSGPLPTAVLLESPTDRLNTFFLSLFGQDVSVPVIVDEYNVRRTTFAGFGANADRATEAAFRALTIGLARDRRVLFLFPYSPWPDDHYDDNLVSIDYAHNHPEPDDETPQGEVLVEYTNP